MIIRHDFTANAGRNPTRAARLPLLSKVLEGRTCAKLYVGLETRALAPVSNTGAWDELHMSGTRFMDLQAACFSSIAPSTIISPLLLKELDAIDIAQKLVRLGFRGQYIALAWQLPDPGIVEAEIRAVAPGMDVAVVPVI